MKLNAIQLKILTLLFEAGEENIPTLANMIWSESDDIDKDTFLTWLNAAIEGMNTLGFVSLAIYREKEKASWQELSDSEFARFFPIHRCLEWNSNLNYWQWRELDCGNERVTVLIEESGKIFLSDYLSTGPDG
jgi:hypothetical protein